MTVAWKSTGLTSSLVPDVLKFNWHVQYWDMWKRPTTQSYIIITYCCYPKLKWVHLCTLYTAKIPITMELHLWTFSNGKSFFLALWRFKKSHCVSLSHRGGEGRHSRLQVPPLARQGPGHPRGGGSVRRLGRRTQRPALLLPVHPHGGDRPPEARLHHLPPLPAASPQGSLCHQLVGAEHDAREIQTQKRRMSVVFFFYLLSLIRRTLIHGDKKGGFTVFWADDGLDTGPILLQRECDVEPNDTVNTIYKRFLFPEGVKGTVSLTLFVCLEIMWVWKCRKKCTSQSGCKNLHKHTSSQAAAAAAAVPLLLRFKVQLQPAFVLLPRLLQVTWQPQRFSVGVT